jgi:hypothetical protein
VIDFAFAPALNSLVESLRLIARPGPIPLQATVRLVAAIDAMNNHGIWDIAGSSKTDREAHIRTACTQ